MKRETMVNRYAIKLGDGTYLSAPQHGRPRKRVPIHQATLWRNIGHAKNAFLAAQPRTIQRKETAAIVEVALRPIRVVEVMKFARKNKFGGTKVVSP